MLFFFCWSKTTKQKSSKLINVVLLSVPDQSPASGASSGRDQDGVEAALQPEEDRQGRLQRNTQKMRTKGNHKCVH
jgi:hypothetical protein